MLKLSGGGAGAISQKGKIKNQVSSTPLIITGKSIRYMLHHEGNVPISICNLRGQSLSVLKNVHQTSEFTLFLFSHKALQKDAIF
jgi:hypothetical protein